MQARREDARDDASHVRIDQGRATLERETRDRARGVGTDAREPAQRGRLRRERGDGRRRRARVVTPRGRSFPHDGPRQLVQVARTRVVTESLPGRDHVRLARGGERFERGEPLEEARIELHHARDLRLLEHQLRDEDVVGVAGVAPGQVARVAAKPGAKAHAERAQLRRVESRPRQCGSHVGTAEKIPPSTINSRARSSPNAMLSAPAASRIPDWKRVTRAPT